MNYLRSEMNHEQIEYRRDRVIELYSEGRSRKTIAKTLRLSKSIVQRDIHYRMQETQDRVRTFLDERLPFEHEVCRVGLNRILERTWDMINNPTGSDKTRLQALSLAKECYKTRLELLDSKIEVEHIMQSITQYKRQQEELLRSSTSTTSLHPRFETNDYRLSNAKF